MGKTVKEVLLKAGKTRRKSSGDKKHGRNKVKCARYRAEGRREKNKIRKARTQKNRVQKKARKKARD